jgi:hypothetical protein
MEKPGRGHTWMVKVFSPSHSFPLRSTLWLTTLVLSKERVESLVGTSLENGIAGLALSREEGHGHWKLAPKGRIPTIF